MIVFTSSDNGGGKIRVSAALNQINIRTKEWCLMMSISKCQRNSALLDYLKHRIKYSEVLWEQ